MADSTVKESSCLARDIFTRRDHYHCGPDRAVKKCDTLLTIAHEAWVRRSDKIVAHRTRGSTLAGTLASHFTGENFLVENTMKKKRMTNTLEKYKPYSNYLSYSSISQWNHYSVHWKLTVSGPSESNSNDSL